MEPQTLRIPLRLVTLLILVFLIHTTQAGVNLKNGNFYITYTDVETEGFEVVRTYNSRATESSEFGFGWGWDLATYLSPLPDGRVMVHENGSGSLDDATLFSGKQTVDSAVDLAWLHLRGRLPRSALSINTNVRKVVSDSELRASYLLRSMARGLMLVHLLDQGACFTSTRHCNNPECTKPHGWQLAKRGELYIRRRWDGYLEHFDAGRRLSVVKSIKTDTNLVIARSALGEIKSIDAGNGITFAFDYDDRGRLNAVRDSVGFEARYQINEAGDLVYSRDTAGNEYRHEYDKNHNMTRVTYPDQTSLEIRYNEKQFCNYIKDRKGMVTEYEYGQNPQNPDLHYWTTVRKTDSTGTALPENRYEFLIANPPGGRRYTQRIVESVDGVTTTTNYLQDGSIKSETTDGSEPLIFEYSGGKIIKVAGPKSLYQLHYFPQTNLLQEITITAKNSPSSDMWTFSYDDSQLSEVNSNQGSKLVVSSESKPPVLTVDGTAIHFDKGKVSLDGEAWYEVAYRCHTKDGKYLAELKNADGVALKVPQLESLLNLIRPPLAVIASRLPSDMEQVRWESFDP